jgi:hypothetical protein
MIIVFTRTSKNQHLQHMTRPASLTELQQLLQALLFWMWGYLQKTTRQGHSMEANSEDREQSSVLTAHMCKPITTSQTWACCIVMGAKTKELLKKK